MTTFSEKQKFLARTDVWSTAIAADDTDAAYGVCDDRGDGQIVLGRFFDDVGGGAPQLNELDRVDVAGLSLVFHNKTLVCGSTGDVVLFDVSAGTLNQRGVLQGHTYWVRCVAAHGDWLASGGNDETERIWSVTTLEQMYCKTDHTSYVTSVCFSHDGRWLVSGSFDESVVVYDSTRDFARHTTLTLTLNAYVYAVCFSPDDSLLAVGANNGCSAIYSVDAFERRRTLTGDHVLLCVAWLGNDAGSLVGGTPRGKLVVWNWSSGIVSSQQKVNDLHFNSLSFTSSFRTLLTGNDDRTARVFDVYFHPKSRATAALCGDSLHAFRTLRRTNLGALVMQLIAEALAGSLEPLSEHERTRIFTASRVTSDVRGQRLATLEALDNYHAHMHWLRTSSPPTPAASSSRSARTRIAPSPQKIKNLRFFGGCLMSSF